MPALDAMIVGGLKAAIRDERLAKIEVKKGTTFQTSLDHAATVEAVIMDDNGSDGMARIAIRLGRRRINRRLMAVSEIRGLIDAAR